MMKVITGNKFKTADGLIIVHNEQDEKLYEGERVLLDGKTVVIAKIIPPSKPSGKWSILLGWDEIQ